MKSIIKTILKIIFIPFLFPDVFILWVSSDRDFIDIYKIELEREFIL